MAVSLGKTGGVFASTEDETSTFTNQATTADAAKVRYAITDRSKSAWPLGSAIVVKKNGTIQTTGFAIEYATGTVVFDAALTSETVTVGGNYQPVAEVGGFYQWAIDDSTAAVSSTDFVAARAGWETFAVAGLFGSGVTASRYWDTGGFVERVGLDVLIKCYVSVATGEHWVGWAICDKAGTTQDATKLVDEAIHFTVNGPMLHRDAN